MSDKGIYHIMYKTPLGFMFTDIEAESRDEALREFWSQHHRDTCDVIYTGLLMSSCTDCGCDKTANDGGEEPPGTVPEPFFLDMGEARNCGSPYTAIAIVAFTILGFLLGFILARMT